MPLVTSIVMAMLGLSLLGGAGCAMRGDLTGDQTASVIRVQVRGDSAETPRSVYELASDDTLRAWSRRVDQAADKRPVWASPETARLALISRRVLSRTDADAVRLAARSAIDAVGAHPPRNPALVRDADVQHVVLIEDDFASDFAVGRTGDGPPPTQGLVEMLAALAWIDDVEPARVRAGARRYDFGPDPYAPYR